VPQNALGIDYFRKLSECHMLRGLIAEASKFQDEDVARRALMEVVIRHVRESEEFMTPEGCSILESWNDEADPTLSIARARVAPGVTTKLHRVRGTVERYLIISGSGVVTVGDVRPERVGPGDVVVIPPGISQKIENDGTSDLVFYAICSPRFTPDAYDQLE
jgi:mannose-6-phosphate isomerase-like protein (cupin superfamily)